MYVNDIMMYITGILAENGVQNGRIQNYRGDLIEIFRNWTNLTKPRLMLAGTALSQPVHRIINVFIRYQCGNPFGINDLMVYCPERFRRSRCKMALSLNIRTLWVTDYIII